MVRAAPFQDTDPGHAHGRMVAQDALGREHLGTQMGSHQESLEAVGRAKLFQRPFPGPGHEGQPQELRPGFALLIQGRAALASYCYPILHGSDSFTSV